MAVRYKDLKVGTVIKHDLGFTGKVVSITDEKTINVEIINPGHTHYSVGYARNCHVSRMEYIISQPEEDMVEEAFEVEMELDGVIIRMDYKNLEKFMKFMKTL